jgi:hypothetical protein
MSKYKMNNGIVVDTDRAQRTWDEARRFDDKNYISVATGSQWAHQRLHKARRGRYYIEHWSQSPATATAEWISMRAAAAWLIANEHAVPDDLAKINDGHTTTEMRKSK